MPLRIVDMHEIEAGVTNPECGRMRLDDDPACRRRFLVARPIGAVGCTMMAGKFSRPINVSTTRSAATLLCL